MPTSAREWLVRTRNREVFGPFSQRELLEELQKNTFTADDEIASSAGQWISAQTLLHREVDEVTRTQTRNQTFSQSITVDNPGTEPAPKVEELTPTPESPAAFPKRAEPKAPKPSRAPLFLTAVLSALFVTILFLAIKETPSSRQSVIPANTPNYIEGESPFVKEIYRLIQAGESQVALKKLTAYHEKQPAKDDLEYLIPYSALLITEGESPSRAKKFLEQVISAQVSPALKSRAHHWLGYLALSDEDGDMGENHFLEALQLNPKDPAARFNLGRAYLKQRRYSQALDYLQLAELEVPELWLVHLFKGRAKNALGNTEEARSSFKIAIQSSPERWITYIYFATFLKLNNEWDQARQTLRKMLTQDPRYELQSPPPFGFYQEKVDYEQYLKIFAEVMERYPGEEKELGKLYLTYLLGHANGSPALVGKQIERMAERDSLFGRVLALQVLIDRDARAEEIKSLFVKLPPNLNDFGYYAYVLRGDAKLRLGLVGEAQKDFERALLLEPKSAVAHWAYANLLKRLNRKNDAHSELRSLLSVHPTYIPGLLSNHEF
jgi:tetratricopeptide (TPR) repeat protein